MTVRTLRTLAVLAALGAACRLQAQSAASGMVEWPVYGGSLGGLIEQFFGSGDWAPRV